MYTIRNINKIYENGYAEIVIITTISTKLGDEVKTQVFPVEGGAKMTDEQLFALAEEKFGFTEGELKFAEKPIEVPAEPAEALGKIEVIKDE